MGHLGPHTLPMKIAINQTAKTENGGIGTPMLVVPTLKLTL